MKCLAMNSNLNNFILLIIICENNFIKPWLKSLPCSSSHQQLLNPNQESFISFRTMRKYHLQLWRFPILSSSSEFFSMTMRRWRDKESRNEIEMKIELIINLDCLHSINSFPNSHRCWLDLIKWCCHRNARSFTNIIQHLLSTSSLHFIAIKNLFYNSFRFRKKKYFL
jgi:hypothetical protein